MVVENNVVFPYYTLVIYSVKFYPFFFLSHYTKGKNLSYCGISYN